MAEKIELGSHLEALFIAAKGLECPRMKFEVTRIIRGGMEEKHNKTAYKVYQRRREPQLLTRSNFI